MVFLILCFQISDFYQRRMIQSSPSMEQDKSKADVKETDSEQELEVWMKALLLPRATLIPPYPPSEAAFVSIRRCW